MLANCFFRTINNDYYDLLNDCTVNQHGVYTVAIHCITTVRNKCTFIRGQLEKFIIYLQHGLTAEIKETQT